MAQNRTDQDAIQANTAESSPVPGQPQEELEVRDDAEAEGNFVYPTGFRLWTSVISLFLTMFFVGLDMTIVAVVVPSLTNQYKTVDDIGWYSAAYMVIYSSFTFFFAKLYTVFSVKRLFLASICVFQLGSLLCTIAPASYVFILGRAIAGLGSSGLSIGAFIVMAHSFPLHKRPLWTGVAAATQSIAMVFAPLIGVLTFVLTANGFQNPIENPDTELPLVGKLKKMDLLGTFFFVPSIVCLLVGLQWGGIKYGWNNAIIIVLFIFFAILISIFSYIQYRNQEKATLPPRILKQRSVLAGAWFSACCNGILAVTEYYIAIYFQGVKGFSATKSGALGLPLIIGLGVAGLLASTLTTLIGYYYPFMLATSILAPIAAGLLTTLDLDESIMQVLCLLGFLGAAVGLGLQGPVVAVQTVLPMKDISTGLAITGFGGGLGSSLFISASSTLFQNRLAKEVDETLYLPVALAALTIFGSVAMERRSVKKKQS